MRSGSLLAATLLFVLTSCNKKTKENPIPVNTITATVDGVETTFNSQVTAVLSNVSGFSELRIYGRETSDFNSGVIVMVIDTTAAITKGTYYVKSGTPNGFFAGPAITYSQGYLIFYPSANTAQTNTIAISSISSTNVQGTFNATLSDGVPGTSSPDKVFANGKFNLPITQNN